MLRPLALLACLALAACQSTTSAMKTWIGSSDAELMAAWGAPDLEASTSSGRVLTYNGRNGYGQIICRKTFVLDDRRRVVSATNNCPL